ncbi:SDR family NAD(P)-dependent oxidoreductase [Streptomyces sp. NPDC001978]|uniref:SDR family NAD(P)-dependent oxidoreductase n=1 Tax=Streptomyces sp. NPDC001978 TaxID=3364627 RepID=UPI0036903218
MGKLSGKVALVTGAAAGIGAATAEVLVGHGAQVVLGDIRGDLVEETAKRIGDAASAVTYDAADTASVEHLVDEVIARHGRLDVLHNNAAITAQAWTRDTTVLDTELDWFDMTLRVNLRSGYIAAKRALPHMIAGGGGAIVNMASIAAFSGGPTLVAYGISKAGVAAMTKYLAAQYGRHNIRTNCIAPGAVLTEQVLENVPGVTEAAVAQLPYTRAGQGTDIGNVVAFLASEDAAYINGQVITVDGGGTAGIAPPLDSATQAGSGPVPA